MIIEILRGTIAIVFLLSFAIFIHELGHFFFAKLFGVRVETFSIGFGKKILKFKRGDTEYCISAIPLGGYVKMVGMHSQEMDDILSGEKPASAAEEADAELAAAELDAPAPLSLGQSVIEEVNALRSKPYWQKFLVFSAGCINNFLSAVAVVFLMNWIGHHEPPPTPPIVEAIENVDLSQLPIRPGDKFLSISNKPVKEYSQIFSEYEKAADKKHAPASVPAVVQRDHLTTTVEIPTTPPIDPSMPVGTIVSVNGKPAGSAKSIIRIVAYLNSIGKTEPVSVVIRKPGGEELNTSVPLAGLMGKDWPELAFQPHQPAYVVQPLPNLPAEKAGMRVADEIVAIANVPVSSAVQATHEIRKHLGETIPITVHRKPARGDAVRAETGEFTSVTLQVEVRPHPENPNMGQIGIAWGPGPFTDFVKKPFAEALPGAFVFAYVRAMDYILGIGDLVQSSFQTVRENVGGPIAIGTMAYKAANQGWFYYFNLFIMFNIILAITNLLPLPILDGGHILFSTIEALIRRPLPAKFMLVIYNAFTFLIIGLALVITFNDVVMNWWRIH